MCRQACPPPLGHTPSQALRTHLARSESSATLSREITPSAMCCIRARSEGSNSDPGTLTTAAQRAPRTIALSRSSACSTAAGAVAAALPGAAAPGPGALAAPAAPSVAAAPAEAATGLLWGALSASRSQSSEPRDSTARRPTCCGPLSLPTAATGGACRDPGSTVPIACAAAGGGGCCCCGSKDCRNAAAAAASRPVLPGPLHTVSSARQPCGRGAAVTHDSLAWQRRGGRREGHRPATTAQHSTDLQALLPQAPGQVKPVAPVLQAPCGPARPAARLPALLRRRAPTPPNRCSTTAGSGAHPTAAAAAAAAVPLLAGFDVPPVLPCDPELDLLTPLPPLPLLVLLVLPRPPANQLLWQELREAPAGRRCGGQQQALQGGGAAAGMGHGGAHQGTAAGRLQGEAAGPAFSDWLSANWKTKLASITQC